MDGLVVNLYVAKDLVQIKDYENIYIIDVLRTINVVVLEVNGNVI